MSHGRKLVNRSLLAVTLFLVCTMCSAVFGEELKETYDGRCESPMPPEAIASLLDEVIEDHPGNVTLTLVRPPKPLTQPALPAYQAKHFDRQVTEIRLIDRETESWEVTVEPFQPSVGGEIWIRFSNGDAVSAEFGR